MRRMSRVLLATVAVMALAAVPSMAQNSLDVNGTAALNGTSFGLELMFQPGQSNIAFVQDDSPSAETVYRAAWWMDANNFDGVEPARNFFFFAHGDNAAFPGPPLPIIRALIFTVNGNKAFRMSVWDNANNPKGILGCLIPSSGPIQVEFEWTAGNVPTPGDLVYRVFDGGVEICEESVAGGIQNGFITANFQSFQTRPEGGVQSNTSLYIDEFESFRTLGAS